MFKLTTRLADQNVRYNLAIGDTKSRFKGDSVITGAEGVEGQKTYYRFTSKQFYV
jgi:hypothetical protein